MPPEQSTFQLTLLENGLDFIIRGIAAFDPEEVQDGSSQKYALLHIFAGVLLLIKERLRREHDAFIFVDVQDVSAKDPSKCRTVDFTLGLQRLEKIAKVALKPEDLSLLRSVQSIRNQLEHSHVNLELRHTQHLLGRLTEFVYLFLRDHLEVRLEEHFDFETLRRVSELQEIAKRIDAENHTAWRKRAERYFNLSDQELDGLVDGEPYHPKHNPDPQPSYTCPQCAEESLVLVSPDTAVCTNYDCREVFHVLACERCGGPNIASGVFCEDCTTEFENFMDKD